VLSFLAKQFQGCDLPRPTNWGWFLNGFICWDFLCMVCTNSSEGKLNYKKKKKNAVYKRTREIQSVCTTIMW